MKARGQIFILSGPSGSGKTTLYRRLLKSGLPLTKIVSVTTRPRRPGERHGRDYYFVSQRMFKYKERAGHFLESEEVFGHSYGTPKKAVRELLRSGRHLLLCIDVKGAKTVHRHFPEAVRIFVKTPTVRELRQRLSQRDTEDPLGLAARLRRAKEELEEARFYDYVIVNDDLQRATDQLKDIICQHLSK